MGYYVIVDKSTGEALRFVDRADVTIKQAKREVRKLNRKKELQVDLVVAQTAPPFRGVRWDSEKNDWKPRDQIITYVDARGEIMGTGRIYKDQKLPRPNQDGLTAIKGKPPKHTRSAWFWNHKRKEWQQPERRAIVNTKTKELVNIICVGPDSEVELGPDERLVTEDKLEELLAKVEAP